MKFFTNVILHPQKCYASMFSKNLDYKYLPKSLALSDLGTYISLIGLSSHVSGSNSLTRMLADVYEFAISVSYGTNLLSTMCI